MRILLDTHAFIWMVSDRKEIFPAAIPALEDPANEIVFSTVVAWEITSKRSKGKLHFSGSPLAKSRRIGLTELDITAEQCEVAADLPPHHRDPFDRILIAQAQIEGLVLATRDSSVKHYGIRTLRV